MTTLSTPRAMSQLMDAMRAELIAELAEKLTKELGATATDDESYLDGWRDAVRTLEGM